MTLKDYAVVRTGLVLSRKEAKSEEYSHKYRILSLKNVTDDGHIRISDVDDYFTTVPLKKEYFSRKGDVLLRLISPYTPVYISEKEIDLLLPAHFAIIRPNGKVDPRYLQWWLMKNKKRFYQMASGGTLVGTISSGYIADMPFEPLPIQQQREIAELYELSQREQLLLSKLSIRKKQLIDATIAEVVRRGEAKL